MNQLCLKADTVAVRHIEAEDLKKGRCIEVERKVVTEKDMTRNVEQVLHALESEHVNLNLCMFFCNMITVCNLTIYYIYLYFSCKYSPSILAVLVVLFFGYSHSIFRANSPPVS